ncbi:DUF664 domain-containing protein [Streptomyces sp. NRRL S-87]|uniref:mycothiol transferase n=1 Tax=Streptomyces sp. NRRL S-87 TaxID=1463920 RepID=UPI00099C98C4|nr:DUF664 domain-containing protein [Streptomyces sp. NRRL S-87]
MTDDTVPVPVPSLFPMPPAEPSSTAGEVEMLLFALDRSRAQFAWKCGGLDAAALNRPHPPSALTLGGLLKHMALVEERYAVDFTGEAPGPPLDVPEAVSDPQWVWRSAADETPEELYGLWRGAAGRSRAAMVRALADGGLDRPAAYTAWADGTPVNLRRIVVDLHDEYARHVGHADLLREAVDGLVGEDPPR